MLTSTIFTAPVYKIYGDLIVGNKFEPAGLAAPLGLKDIKMALAAADELRVPLPIGSLLRDRLTALLAMGADELDWSAMARLAARDAGL
jgi:3-hydroxyisobutyrate dehydrogenase-like beta-hydroxyacid dehydrogenase